MCICVEYGFCLWSLSMELVVFISVLWSVVVFFYWNVLFFFLFMRVCRIFVIMILNMIFFMERDVLFYVMLSVDVFYYLNVLWSMLKYVILFIVISLLMVWFVLLIVNWSVNV